MIDVKRTAAGVKPTLTDNDVLQFCNTGFLTLEGVIPDEFIDAAKVDGASGWWGELSRSMHWRLPTRKTGGVS